MTNNRSQQVANDRKPYAKPTLEERAKLADVAEVVPAVLLSGVVINGAD